MTYTRQDILDLLTRVKDKQTKKNLLELGFKAHITIKEKEGVQLILDVPPPFLQGADGIKREIEKLFSSEKVEPFQLLMTSQRGHQEQPSPQQRPKTQLDDKLELPHLKNIIAVASGKGGVGKSTIAFNLTHALKQNGYNVALLDLDIYGPSLPTLTKLSGEPDKKDEKMIPFMKDGIPTMSMGYMIPPEKAVIWRGPLVQIAVQQLLRDVDWGERDVLILDLPPGTGDTQLTLAQSVPMTGAVIVTTPQDLSLIDARKAIDMFRTVKVPVCGLIENMSLFTCPHCGEATAIFDEDGGEKEALKQHIPFLGKLPLTPTLRALADQGFSIFDQKAHEEKDVQQLRQMFLSMAQALMKNLQQKK